MMANQLFHPIIRLVRFMFILSTNIYAISAYLVWMIPLWPLRFLMPSLYWTVEAAMFKGLLAMVVTWLYTGKYTLIESGDDIRSIHDQEAILMPNHQSTGDVPTLMAAIQGKDMAGGQILWIMDWIFRYTHFGAVSQSRKDFFIKQGRDTRGQQLVNLKEHLKKYYKALDRKWIAIFPEGGFLYKLKESNKKYAEKNNFPVWNNVALPRLGAVKTVLDMLAVEPAEENRNYGKKSDITMADSSKRLQWIIDLTIAYPEGKPLTLMGVGIGDRPPCEVLLHYRAYDVSEIPRDADGLTQWLYDRYGEKEAMLEEYYKHGTPLSSTDHQKRILPRRKDGPCDFDGLNIVLWHIFYLVSFFLQISYFYKPIFSLILSPFH